MGVISQLLASAIDVGKDVIKEAAPKIAKEVKDRGIISKEFTAIENFAKRVADKWVNQSDKVTEEMDSAAAWRGDKPKVKDLGTIMKEESSKLGKELLLGLIPLLPTVEREQNYGNNKNNNNNNKNLKEEKTK